MKYFGQIENIFRIGQDRFTHIFGSFQDSKKGSQGHMRFTANIKIYWVEGEGMVKLCSEIKDCKTYFEAHFTHLLSYCTFIELMNINSVKNWQWSQLDL